jgi:hypothetical protein
MPLTIEAIPGTDAPETRLAKIAAQAHTEERRSG